MLLSKVISKLAKQTQFLVAILKVTDENSRIWSRIQIKGMDPPDLAPDPYQNVRDTLFRQQLLKSSCRPSC